MLLFLARMEADLDLKLLRGNGNEYAEKGYRVLGIVDRGQKLCGGRGVHFVFGFQCGGLNK